MNAHTVETVAAEITANADGRSLDLTDRELAAALAMVLRGGDPATYRARRDAAVTALRAVLATTGAR